MTADLRTLLDRLTTDTRQVVHTATGPILVIARPLLTELQDLIENKSGSTDGRSSSDSGSGAPIELEALTLMARIHDDVAHLQWLARSTPGTLTPRPGLGGMTLIQRLRWTASILTGGRHEPELHTATRTWTTAIERLFDPPRVLALRHSHQHPALCPACHQGTTPVWDEGQEEWVNVPALTVTMASSPHARCGECGAEWRGSEVVDLAVQLGAPPSVAHLLGA